MICMYLKIPGKFVCLIFLDGFYIVHTPFIRMVEFQLLAQFLVDHFAHPSCLALYSFCANFLWLLYIDLRPSQTCHSKEMHQKEVTHSDGSYKKSRRRIWLTKWDKVKAHDTLIDWCTGREWPVNCMTVISAWWRSNMPFQRLSGRLNYYITRWRQEVRSWRIDELGTRWVRDEVGRESQQKAEPPGLRLSIRRTRPTHGDVRRRWWGQYVAVFVHSPTPSHTQTLLIRWEVYFLKKSSLVFIHCVSMYSAHICICIMCL